MGGADNASSIWGLPDAVDNLQEQLLVHPKLAPKFLRRMSRVVVEVVSVKQHSAGLTMPALSHRAEARRRKAGERASCSSESAAAVAAEQHERSTPP
jgi:hypothetical protein